jgi:hypothetical protein
MRSLYGVKETKLGGWVLVKPYQGSLSQRSKEGNGNRIAPFIIGDSKGL